MVDCITVAHYVLEQTGPITTMKLQKLVYYAQALHLVCYQTPLFSEPIQAWANGPVIPALFEVHRGRYMVDARTKPIASSDDSLIPEDRAVVDAVVHRLGSFTGEQLRERTHRESPWRDARGECSDGDRCQSIITCDSMMSYYSSAGGESAIR